MGINHGVRTSFQDLQLGEIHVRKIKMYAGFPVTGVPNHNCIYSVNLCCVEHYPNLASIGMDLPGADLVGCVSYVAHSREAKRVGCVDHHLQLIGVGQTQTKYRGAKTYRQGLYPVDFFHSIFLGFFSPQRTRHLSVSRLTSSRPEGYD